MIHSSARLRSTVGVDNYSLLTEKEKRNKMEENKNNKNKISLLRYYDYHLNIELLNMTPLRRLD